MVGVSHVRVLVVHPGSDFSVDDVHRGYVKGLRQCGVQVAEYNLNDRLAWYANVRYGDAKQALDSQEIIERAAYGLHGKLWEWMPDLIVVISGFYVLPMTWQILAGRKFAHRTAIVFTESPYEDDRQLNLVEKAEPDVVIVNDPINIDSFRAVHDRVAYLPHCYDPEVHFPGRGRRDVDFSFVGTGYPSRIHLFEQADWSGLHVRFAGHWKGLGDNSPLVPFLLTDRAECYENADTADLYRQSKASANLYRGNDPAERNADNLADGWAVGPREIELAATETFFLREARGEGDELFPMLPTFTDADDFSDKLRYYLSHDKQRENAAVTARARIEDRTFNNNARRLLELVDRT